MLAQTWVGSPEDEAVEQGGIGDQGSEYSSGSCSGITHVRSGTALYEVDYWESEVRRVVRRSAKGSARHSLCDD